MPDALEESRALNEKLYATLGRLEIALGGISDAIVWTDAQGMVQWCNASFDHMVGRPHIENLGLPIIGLLPLYYRGRSVPHHAHPASLAVRNQTSVAESYELVAGAETLTLEITWTRIPIGQDEGDLIFLLRDVTAFARVNNQMRDHVDKLMRSEQELRRLAAVVISSHNAIIATTLDGIVTDWNPGAERLFGYSAQEMLGKHIHVLALPESHKRIQEDLESIRQGRSLRFETARLRKDGTVVEVEATLSPILDKTGNVSGCSRIEQDIAERKHAHDELVRSNEQLDLFASVVSHEFQEPLRKILLFGALLGKRADAPEEERADYLRRMTDAAARMRSLIQNFLEMSRITGESKRTGPVDLNEIVKAVAADFQSRISEGGGAIDVGPLPTVAADALQMHQLFQNLISNAIKFRKKDEPLRISIFFRPASASAVQIVVEDNGIGFDPQFSRRIFKPFRRLHRRGEYPGSGLGLSICERIAELHGGRISVKSEAGKGSSFIVTLPLPAERQIRTDKEPGNNEQATENTSGRG